jgi:hypothetical protein
MAARRRLVPTRPDRRRGCLDLGLRARRERHMRARRRKRRGGREPDAAPAAGDEGAPAVETEGGSLGELDFGGRRHLAEPLDSLPRLRGREKDYSAAWA